MRILTCLLLLVATLAPLPAAVPVIYCTDLFHPHEDPDDHFDLATLFALPELEVKAILLDQGKRQKERPGSVPVQQLLRLSGRQVPVAIGLAEKLASPTDDGRAQPAEFQVAVELLLQKLRESPGPVTIITAGSVRDVCAAWNRDPGLLKQKVARLYLNIGNANEWGSEYNVDLDPQAYIGILRSGLPLYLCCCMPMQNQGSNVVYSTYWRFRQSDVLESAPPGLQNYFIYGLQRPSPDELDPWRALQMNLRPWRRLVWEMDRNMWCTASFLDAAGRGIYQTNRSWTLYPPPAASAKPETLFTFVPARIEVEAAGKTRIQLDAPNPNLHLFKITRPEKYGEAMRDILRELLQSLEIKKTSDDARSSVDQPAASDEPGLFKPFLAARMPWLYN